MKDRLRERIRRKPATRGASAAIQRRLLAEDWWAAAFVVGLYRSTPGEVGTEELWADLAARGARVAAPMRRGAQYAWGWVEPGARWKTGAHGIAEPAGAAGAAPGELRLVVVPGLAFDARGGRLGRGGGHFDRLLAGVAGLRVGLCAESQLVAAVPMEAHDAPMDVVVTEKRVIYAPTAAAKLEWLAAGGAAAGEEKRGG